MGNLIAYAKDSYNPVLNNLWYSIFAESKKYKKIQNFAESNKKKQ